RGRGDDDLEVRSLRQELGQVAEDEVDVEAAFVRLVDDDRVVAAQQRVALDLGEQDPVGHQLDQRGVRDLVGEPDLVADGAAHLDTELLGEAFGHGPRGDPARLRVADGPGDPAAELEADLRDLRRLARSGLPGDDHHLVIADRVRDVLPTRRDRQLLGLGDGGTGGPASGQLLLGPRPESRPPRTAATATPTSPAVAPAGPCRGRSSLPVRTHDAPLSPMGRPCFTAYLSGLRTPLRPRRPIRPSARCRYRLGPEATPVLQGAQAAGTREVVP